MGSQLSAGKGKLLPGNTNLEGAKARKKVSVKYALMVLIVILLFKCNLV